MDNIKLTIELIPSSAWFNNLRNLVDRKTWDVIRKKCYQDANYRCEICKGKGRKWPVECHEKWDLVDNKIILKGLIALCPSCHEVKHIGFAATRGRFDIARKHFMKINDISLDVANKYIEDAFKVFDERSKEEWELDLTYLKNYIK